jgi:hypothetical protein
MALPVVIPIAHEPWFRTKYIGRYAHGQFYGDIHGTKIDGLGKITVMLHLFDQDGVHKGSTIRSRVPLEEADAVLGEWLAQLPGATFGDIAIRLFEVEQDGVLFGLVDTTHPERGRARDPAEWANGESAELYPQGLGFFPPFEGLYDT